MLHFLLCVHCDEIFNCKYLSTESLGNKDGLTVTLEINPLENRISKPKTPRAAGPGSMGSTSGLSGLRAVSKLASGL